MRRWESQVAGHQLTSNINQIFDILKNGIESTDESHNLEYNRLFKIINRTKEAINQIDADFAPIDTMNTLHGFITNNNIINLCIDAINNKNYALLNQINNTFDSAMSYFNILNKGITKANSSRIDYAISSSTLNKFVSLINEKQKEILNTIENKKNEIENTTNNINSLSSDLKNKENDLNNSINSWNNQIAEITINAKKEYSDVKIKMEQEIINNNVELRGFYENKSKEIIEQFNEYTSKSTNEFTDKISAIKSEAEIKLAEIVALYGLAARDSVTGGHKEIADNEEKSANKWRITTVIIIIFTIAWLAFGIKYYNPVNLGDKEFWFAVAKSISLTTLMISFAVYASKQASLHRLNAKKSRSFFLQIQAFSPFIQDLPETDRHELKKNISEKIFSSDDKEIDKAIIEHGDYKSMDRTLEIIESFKRIFSVK